MESMLQTIFSQAGIELTEKELQLFEVYAHFLQSENEKINLTAITDRDQIYLKHFLDCALISPFIKDYQTIGDIGSGAGFPGVVLAILNPEKDFTLIEPIQKRIRFLSSLIELLGLKNVTLVNKRSEDCIDLREKFDVTTARAVARLSILAELCLPLTKVGGLFIAMKGSLGLKEVEEAKEGLTLLGGQVVDLALHQEVDDQDRYNILIQKKKKTPAKYPRPYGQIKKRPLIKSRG